jgi:hypothetical protein
MNDLIYAYCLTNTPPDLNREVEFKGLKCIESGGFYTVVKMVSSDEFSEENLKKNLSDLAWLDNNARNHVLIISLLMEDCTVIPFNFGTIYRSEEPVKKFMEDYSDSLIDNLLFVEWKEEWTVKIYCDRKVLIDQIDELSEEAAKLEREIMASSPGRAFLMKRKKTDLIENEADRLCKVYGQEYFDEFKKLSDSFSLNNLIPKEFSERSDDMILNSTFLVGKDKAIDIVSTSDSLRKKNSGLGFDLEITGPWPPFSFITIKEKNNAR